MTVEKIVIIMLIVAAALAIFISYQFYGDIDYSPEKYVLDGSDYQYDLLQPNRRFTLPVVLEEVSGIDYYDSGHIVCVQDEEGIVFQYDTHKETIVRKEKFGDGGDYEGIEYANGSMYVLESNGNIFRFAYHDKDIGEVYKFNTPLSSKNDTEGLGFAPEDNALLIACKGSGDTDEIKVDGRAVYTLDLSTHQLRDNVSLRFSKGELKDFLEENGLASKPHDHFRPAGIAVHPGDQGDIFIVGTVGKLLLVCDANGAFKSAIPLDPALMLQPEGITFDPDGRLFISSEGKGDNGYILQFDNLR